MPGRAFDVKISKAMGPIFERVRNIVLRPKETWEAIRQESQSVQELLINFAAPLALIPSVGSLIGLSIFGIMTPSGQIARAPFSEALAGSVLSYFAQLAGLLATAWCVQYLAPYFNSRSDFTAAFKVITYSTCPIFVLGIFSALPGLGVVQVLGLYSFYLLYQGIRNLLEVPGERLLWFTVLVVTISIFINLVLSLLVGGAVYGPMFIRMMAK